MARTETIRARVEPELKQHAEEILSDLGLTPTAAISMLYRQIVLQRALPFEVALPNSTTRRAMQDAKNGRDLIRAENLQDLLSALDADD